MKKKLCTIVIFLLLSVVNVVLDVNYKYPDIPKNSQALVDGTVTSEDVTVVMIDFSYTIPNGESMEGWFAEHLKEKLGIGIQMIDHFDTVGGNFNEDLRWITSPEGYYDAVRKGQLINLEKDIRKYPQIYQRYQKVIEQMKIDTYEHTGKRGVFGFPFHMHSFAAWMEGHCLAIPTYASHPEKAMELIAYSATDEGIMTMAFGPEGKMWEKENGRYVLLQDWHYENSCYVVPRRGWEESPVAIEEEYPVQIELVGNNILGQELLAMTSVNRRDDL